MPLDHGKKASSDSPANVAVLSRHLFWSLMGDTKLPTSFGFRVRVCPSRSRPVPTCLLASLKGWPCGQLGWICHLSLRALLLIL